MSQIRENEWTLATSISSAPHWLAFFSFLVQPDHPHCCVFFSLHPCKQRRASCASNYALLFPFYHDSASRQHTNRYRSHLQWKVFEGSIFNSWWCLRSHDGFKEWIVSTYYWNVSETLSKVHPQSSVGLKSWLNSPSGHQSDLSGQTHYALTL